MTENIDQLAEKIYQEGVARAEAEAADLRAAAEAEAEKIRQQAEADAQATRQRAEAEAADLRRHTEADVRVAAGQALDALKQRIRHLLGERLLQQPARAAFTEADFLQKLILEVVRQQATDGEGNLQLPAALQAEIGDTLAAQLRAQAPGLEITFAGPHAHGFRWRQTQAGYELDFTDDTFVAFFRPYLNRATDQLLFAEPSTTPQKD